MSQTSTALVALFNTKKMKQRYSILFYSVLSTFLFMALLLGNATLLMAQCNTKQLLKESQVAVDNSNYTLAIQKLLSARQCDPVQSAKIDSAIEVMVRRMDQERLVNDSLFQASKVNLEEKEEVLNNLYFFTNRFGLAGDENSYYFIDRKGRRSLNRTYEEALPFDGSGFARVRMAGRYFLLDSTGVEHPLVTELADLNEKTEALDLRNRNLDTFPSIILNYPQLKILLLSDNLLKNIPVEINALVNLKSLHLANNFLTYLPASIGDLTQLLDLNLSKNELASVPVAIGELVNLQKLVLDRNLIVSLPPSIGNLGNLRSLFAVKNKLSALPAELGNLNKLVNLDLGENKITALPASIGQLRNLKYLRLQENRLLQLPKEIGSLTNLQILLLSNNQLSTLPPEIGQLTQLRYLFLFHNLLDTLPISASKMTALTSVLLSGNPNLPLRVICKAFASFPKPFTLSTFSYRSKVNNQVTLRIDEHPVLPPEISLLSNLETLEMPESGLKSLPPELGLLKKLKTIDLTRNELKSLPKEIAGLNNLRSLILYKNELDSLPTGFFNLIKLEELNLGSNNFSNLPSSLGQLINLKTLDLYGNRLLTLPSEIGELTKLKFLSVQNNQLSNLPNTMDRLQSLRNLILFGNDRLPLQQICEVLAKHSRPIVLATEGAKGVKDPRVLLVEINTQDSLPAGLAKMTNLQQIQLFTDSLISIAEAVFLLKAEQLNFADAAYALYVTKNYLRAYQTALINTQKKPTDFTAWKQLIDYSLLAKAYSQTIEAAKKTLELNPNYLEAHSKLAFGYILNGEYPKALPIIKEWKEVPLIEGSYKTQFLADLEMLEAAGITHPDFAKLRNLLEK
jgi:Leucine-rich repeat (LRR) protein